MIYRTKLFYKSTCPPCQWMSKLVVLFSLGTIRRIAVNSEEAKAFYSHYPEQEGQLVLIEKNRITFGRKVFAAVPRCIVVHWWQVFTSLFKKQKNAVR